MNLLYFWTGGGLAWAGGSTVQVGVSAQSGTFKGLWNGSTATVGADATPIDIWITRQSWVGSIATIAVNALGGQFDGVASSHGRSSTMVLARSRTKTRLHQSRTAMMVNGGRTRSER